MAIVSGVYDILVEFTTAEYLRIWMYPLLAVCVVVTTFHFIRQLCYWG